MCRVTSIHWGFSIGGVGKYASIIDRVNEYSDVEIYSIVILSSGAHVDEGTLNKLNNLEIIKLKSKFDFSWLWKLRSSIKTSRPGLVMTHGFNGHFLMLVERYLLRLNIPLVCSYHGQYHATTPVRKALGMVYNQLTEFYIRYCVSGVIAVADYCRNYLEGRHVGAQKIAVIHNGINDIQPEPDNRKRLRNEWNVSDDEVLLGVASRIDPVKGIGYLLDAFINLSIKYNNIKLVIIGTGTLEHELKDKVADSALEDRIIFTGFRSDINDCLQAMDIFILPSLAEYHSIALLEAMRAGKVIVSSDVGGNTESVRDNMEALIVQPADVPSIESAVSRLIDDPSLGVKISEAARTRFLECFTEEKTIKKTALWLRQFFD